MNRRIVPILALVFAFVVFFAAGELLMRVYTWKFVSYDVEMTRYAMEVKQDAHNPNIGHVHRPNASATLMGVSVEINSDGFRDKEYPVARTPAHRIIFLGDSLTMGWGVRKEHMFETLIEDELNKREPTEIINFGTGNYNTVQETNLFLSKGLKYKPDEVVVFYFINDAEPTPAVSKWEALGNSRFITFFWSRIMALTSRLDEHQSFEGYYKGLYADDQPGWKAAKDAFALLKKTCDEHKIALKVVLLPELHDPAHYPFAAEHRKVLDFLAKLGVPALDVTPAFKDAGEPHRLWVALDDAHPNAQAHAIIARAVLPFIAGDRNGTATDKPL